VKDSNYSSVDISVLGAFGTGACKTGKSFSLEVRMRSFNPPSGKFEPNVRDEGSTWVVETPAGPIPALLETSFGVPTTEVSTPNSFELGLERRWHLGHGNF
jgi:hypothetical protein